MMKKFFLIIGIGLVLILVAIGLAYSPMLVELISAQKGWVTDVKEGDVICHTSSSNQSSLIQLATRSKISHCGIVVLKNGKPYVLEARRTLVLTPLEKFLARGIEGRYWIKRSNKENIKIKYSHYLGRPYDSAFKFDNYNLYCSELVYEIYKKQLGIELSQPKKVKDYLIPGIDKHPLLKKTMQKRGITKEQYVVAPVDIFNSEYLESVK